MSAGPGMPGTRYTQQELGDRRAAPTVSAQTRVVAASAASLSMLRRKDRYVTQPRDYRGFGDGPEDR